MQRAPEALYPDIAAASMTAVGARLGVEFSDEQARLLSASGSGAQSMPGSLPSRGDQEHDHAHLAWGCGRRGRRAVSSPPGRSACRSNRSSVPPRRTGLRSDVMTHPPALPRHAHPAGWTSWPSRRRVGKAGIDPFVEGTRSRRASRTCGAGALIACARSPAGIGTQSAPEQYVGENPTNWYLPRSAQAFQKPTSALYVGF